MRRSYVMFCCYLLLTFVCAGSVPAASKISVHAYDCSGRFSGTVDCAVISNDAVWIPELSERPSLAPWKALQIAIAALGDLELGRAGGDVQAKAIRLVPCGEGWIYLIEFHLTLACEESSQPQVRPSVVAVSMTGEVLAPSRCRASVGKALVPEPE